MQTPSDTAPFFSNKSTHYLSVTMRKSIGDNIQSYRPLLYTLNASIKFPSPVSWHLYYIAHISRITCNILSGIPYFSKTRHKYFPFMKSNAFSESIKYTYKIVFHSQACSKIVLESFFITKPTRCTNFPNLLRHETLHVSGSSSVHYQEFIHCTLGTGICQRGL